MAQVDLDRYRAFWRQRSRIEPTPEMQAAARDARHEAQRLSQLLAAEFGAKRVYLFGSFAWGPEMLPDSDLDLAVEGLLHGKLVFAHARLSSQSYYTVDLVLLERLPERLRSRILKSGILLYGEQS
ncbi:MAG TPA: nucleotidyltransferase domain-containing protein [Anaerolineae bacterium]|nr:nucleotidyltransferase domain-containing protein [Anaerolineae bacterium]